MKDYLFHLFDELHAGRLSRRALLQRASVAGLSLTAVPTGFMPAAAAASNTSQGAKKRGGTIRMASQIPSADPQPITASNGGEVITFQPSLEYLCFPREDYTLDPRLATSWKAEPTQKTWTFTIREGVHWHDGSLLTAADVVATFERLLNPKTGSSAGSVYHGILSFGNVEKVSETEVRFHLDAPFVDFPFLVSGSAYQSAILPKDYEMGSFTKGGIGTGPFILKEYIPQQSATYVANRHYWYPGLPYADGIRITYYGDDPSIVLAMQAGDIDVYPRVPLKGGEALLNNPKITILDHAAAEYRSLHMRVDRPPFTDKRVRQAVALCLNRQMIVKSLFNGNAVVANDHSFAPIYVDTELANRDIPQRKQDYAKARALLAAAGHAHGIKVTLTTENYQEIPQYAVAIKAYCQPAGIDIALDILPTSQYMGSGANQPWLVVPFGMTDWSTRGSASQAIIPEFPCHAAWNAAHWCDPAFDKLFAEYNAELDHQKRQKLALALARIQHDEVPVAIGYWIDARRGTSKRVHGLAAGPYFDLRGVWLS